MEEVEKERFKAAIRDLKSRSGLSWTAIAESAGVHRVSLSRYVACSSIPPHTVLLSVCRVCGADGDDVQELCELLADGGSLEYIALREGLHSECWGDLLEVQS